jgi:hypothetical protein
MVRPFPPQNKTSNDSFPKATGIDFTCKSFFTAGSTAQHGDVMERFALSAKNSSPSDEKQ